MTHAGPSENQGTQDNQVSCRRNSLGTFTELFHLLLKLIDTRCVRSKKFINLFGFADADQQKHHPKFGDQYIDGHHH